MLEKEYKQRISQAITYIRNNVDRNLTVDEIADYCCFSKYYFNRIFRSVVNESLYSFIKRMKLESAAFMLRSNRRTSITDIALLVGYSPSNFATAFKENFGMSASEYRKVNEVPVKESYLSVVEHIKSMKKDKDCFAKVDQKIKIKTLNKLILEYERFIGNYFDLAEHWERFCNSVEERNLMNEEARFIGISYDDPLITDENHCIYDMCITVERQQSVNTHKIEGGKYACYEFFDKLENLSKAYNEIFTIWLPYTKYDIRNGMPIEIYLSQTDAEGRMRIDLCMPIK